MSGELSNNALAVELCGLDALFSSCLKLCICDVLSMQEHDSHLGIYYYGTHLVTTVDIMGVIVKKDVRDKLIIYAVDDGTGVISCACWKTPYNDPLLDTLPRLSDCIGAKNLRLKLTELQKSRVKSADGFDLGSLLHVRGNVTTYKGQREVKASQFTVVEDPNEETRHIQESLCLYQKFYDRPVTLPSQLALELSSGNVALEPINQQSLTDAVLHHLDRHRLQVTSINSLSSCDQLAQLAAQATNDRIWHNTVSDLEACGHLCRNPQTSGQFIVVANSRELHSRVLRIIDERIQQRPEEDGCHFMHIHTELRKLPMYSALSKAALRQCLTALETRSDVIETAHQRYITIR